MSEQLIQQVQSKLNADWTTRKKAVDYTQDELKELDALVQEIKKEKCIDEVLFLTDERLGYSKDSVAALYISGLLSLEKNALNNTALETLVDMFKKNLKPVLVEQVCNTILSEKPDNKFALKTLAECKIAQDKDEKSTEEGYAIYERIIKTDLGEAPIAKELAMYYEKKGDINKANEYYKKAILRFINSENLDETKRVWAILIKNIPEEYDFFQLVRRKFIKVFGELRSTDIMEDLYAVYKKQAADDSAKWDIAIEILKQNLEISPKDSQARKELVECYKGKYASHSQLEDYIRNSNLTQSYRDVFEAINDFEKHIAFDKNSFVFHKTWGVGIIRKLTSDTLKVGFSKKVGEKDISLKMAVTALKPLSKNHIWVKKATMKKPELKAWVKENKKEVLIAIIKSFDNNCDFKRIKAELVPSILDLNEWPSWNTAAKKILDSEPEFGINQNDSSMYTVRTQPVTAEEKLANEFKAQKKFNDRVNLILKYHEENYDKSKEIFADMYSYFTGYLKNIQKVNELVISSYLIVKIISAGSENKQYDFAINETFSELYYRIENPKEIYNAIKKNSVLRSKFLEYIKMLPDWNEQYIKLFPTVLDVALLYDLVEAGFAEDVKKLVRTSFESYKDYRETVLFFFAKSQNEQWFKDADIPYEKQLIALVNIIVITFREINNHVNSTENKKINKTATELLFTENTLYKYMFSKDEDTVKKMYTLVDDIADLEETYKTQTRNKILEKYPNFKFRVVEEKSSQPKGMIVTSKMLKLKKEERDRIETIELPENANEIKDAVAKGDLKENAEFQAAKEKQRDLNARLSKLNDEIARAVEFDPTTSTNAVVAFATLVTLTNKDTNADETYTVLGPWESNPEKKIISYMSPFGNAMIDKKVGDKVSYSVGENTYHYQIKSIEKVDIK